MSETADSLLRVIFLLFKGRAGLIVLMMMEVCKEKIWWRQLYLL